MYALCLSTPAAEEAPDAAIRATVTAWAQAWAAKDVERYLAFYAPAFKPPGGQTREAWETVRRARVTEPRFIEVSIGEVKVAPRDHGRAAASFRQHYRSDRYQDETSKTLELVRDGDRWLIVEERGDLLAAETGAAAALARAEDSGVSATLGKLHLLSAWGQPLRVEVELGALAPGAHDGPIARLASPDAYRQAGIEFDPALSGINMSIERRDGKPIIAVTTRSPVNEPFLKILIELESKSGRVVREYTVLLDLPTDLPPAPARAVMAPTAPAAAAAPPSPPPAPTAPRAKAPAVTEALAYEVVKGDTLAKIAREHMHAGVTFNQMLIALYRANPEAFVRNNINLLLAGRTLKIPDRDAVAAIDPEEARLAVRGSEGTRIAEGQVRPQGGPAAPGTLKDQLKLPRAESEKPGLAAAASDDDRVARELALKEAQSRIEELEKSAADLTKLIEIRNQQIAEHERRAAQAQPAPTLAPVAKPVVEAPKLAVEAPKLAPRPKPAAKARPAPPPPAPEPSLADEYLGNPLVLGGVGGLILLSAGFGAYAWRKKRAARPQFDTTLPSMPAEGPSASSVAAAAEAEGVAATTAAREELDLLTEADVYIAYGRDAQAEQILREALQKGAGRPIVHLRLLHIYAKRHDKEQFEATALKLKGLVNGEGPEWDMAMALGRSIDPGNRLYGQGEAAEVAPNVGMTEVPAVDFDLDAMMSPGQMQRTEPEATRASAAPALDFDIGGTTTGAPVAPEATPLVQGAAPVAGGIDLSTISLDLDEIKSAATSPGGSEAKSQDVATKLDLARTHADIGDNDGARQLLNEVIEEGDAAQREQAKQMLASLG